MNEDLLIQYLSHRCTPAEIRELDKIGRWHGNNAN